MVSISVSFVILVIGYICTWFNRQLILNLLCSYGWQELLCITISVCVVSYTLKIPNFYIYDEL
jgi:hypothetical protein